MSKEQTKRRKLRVDMNKIPYASVVGSLMHAMVCTRSDIAYVVEVVNRFTGNPDKEHWVPVKWILRYLRGTTSVCLRCGLANPVLEGFTDPDMSANIDTNRSTYEYVMTYAEGTISW